MHEPENKMISIKIRLEIFFQHMQWPSEASGVERANKCLVQKSKSRSKSRSKSGKNNRQKEVEGFESRNKVNGKNEHMQSVLNRCQNYTSPRAKKILALGHKISDQSGIRSKFRFVILIMRTVLVRLFVTKSPELFFFIKCQKTLRLELWPKKLF